RALIRTRPDSKWVSDARSRIASILQRRLWLNTGGPQPSGKRPRLTLGATNVRRVTLHAYRVRLEALIHARDYGHGPNETLGMLLPLLIDRQEMSKLGQPVAEWKLALHDRGDHRTIQETVPVPINRPGAYVIVAQTPEITARGLLLITDRILVQKVSRGAA